MKLWLKILIALGLGIATGLIVGPQAEALEPIGKIFMQMINMIIVLLVLASMTVGITRINDPKKLSRVGTKTLALFIFTTVISIFIGLGFAYFFQPGIGFPLESQGPLETGKTFDFGQMLISIIPTNPFASLVEGNMIQIIVFSLFLGISISFSGEKGRPLRELIESLAEIMYKLTGIVMEFSPIGVFAIMASVSGKFGGSVLILLAKLVWVYYLGAFLHLIVIFGGILLLFAKLHPLPFFRGMWDAVVMAFSTGSSSATLPVSMLCCEKMGISKNVCSFVLPLGCTINMNGTAMFQALSAIFVAQAYGINLDMYHVVSIVITATLSAIGTAGIPGSGLIMLIGVLASAGLPKEAVILIAGIDRIRDMIGTVLNILGDAVVAAVVAKQEGELDESLYYRTDTLTLEESEG